MVDQQHHGIVFVQAFVRYVAHEKLLDGWLSLIDQKAKHEQPKAPQKPAKSLTGAFDSRARSWLWECTAQGPLHW
ncbi:hypothetical protein D3C76_1656990 [compost metagenome]